MYFKKKKTFTMVEMMVVFTIMAVLTTGAVVSFGMLTTKRVEKDARMLIADLNWARGKAVTEHIHYGINFDFVSNNYQYTIYKSPNGNVSDFTTANELKKTTLSSKIKLFLLPGNLEVLPTTPNSFWFYSPVMSERSSDYVKIELYIDTVLKYVIVYDKTGFIKYSDTDWIL